MDVRVRVIGLLNWYEENPAWLAECVASASTLCDHLIAVDGPYAAFPGAMRRPASGTDQAETIQRVAAGVGMGCTIHTSREPWWGGEVAKRDFMFKLGLTFAKADDWFLRIDADEVLSGVQPWTRDTLEESPYDVAELNIYTNEPEVGEYSSPFRCLYRALPDIAIEHTHYYVTAGRRVLNGGGVLWQEPADFLDGVRLEHRTHQRPIGRKALKNAYSAVINDLEKVPECP